MFKDILLKDGINYISKDDLEKEAKSRNKISSREKLNFYRSKSDFAKTNLIQNGSSHKIYYSEMVLDDYLQWLDNNYGKKNVLAKQKTVGLNTTVSSKPVITTQQIADQLNTTKDVILLYAEQVLPNKEIKHGITTYWTEEEVTLILEYAKTHVGNNRSEEMKEKEIKDRIKEIEKSIPVSQIIYGYKPADEKQELLFHEYLLLKQLYDLYSSSEYRIIVK